MLATPEVEEGPDDQGLAPLFKWAGGKRFLVPYLRKYVPETFGRYYEPFFGSGALFFGLRPQAGVLSDKNAELMAAYKQLRDNPHGLIQHLRRMKNDEDEYYRIRASRPTSSVGQAARFLYLANFAFNGIYRVNLNGEFNVPYGHNDDHPPRKVFSAERLYAISDALQGCRLLSLDFEGALAGAQPGDFVYLDPPYTVAHGQNGFVKYNAKIFSWEDQVRLAKVATEIGERGCHVVISNAYHATIRELYAHFDRHRVRRHSIMSADVSYRRRISEYVLTSPQKASA